MLLAAAIVRYNYRHKRNPLAVVIMGLCRALVYCVAASAMVTIVVPRVLIAAFFLAAYVAGLSVVARRLGPRAGVVIPLLIAGISLFDAAVIAMNGGSLALVGIAAAGFPLTLVAQRIVPGT
jgi:4-hydroxybenzoate polyprenyltransferase